MLDMFYKGVKVLVTGHSGFKGSWLCLLLERLGADVVGYSSLPPSTPDHFSLCRPGCASVEGDIRDMGGLRKVMRDYSPELVLHLAAQPLVRRSYRVPVETFEVNVVGAAMVMEACRETESVRAVINVTSDKCYHNREWPWGYREDDELGGRDPYSASKACAELVTASFGRSFFDAADRSVLWATARAGNVLGGGDWGEDRLVPDLMRDAASGVATDIRNPQAVRPWQHVLDPLTGYLMLGRKLLEGDRDFVGAWNFGPSDSSLWTVGQVAKQICGLWPGSSINLGEGGGPHEAGMLKLDSSKARLKLGWRPRWDAERCIRETVAWYKDYYENGKIESRAQVEAYLASPVEDDKA